MLINFTPENIKFHFKQIYSRRGNKIEWIIEKKKRKFLYSFTLQEAKDLLKNLKVLEFDNKPAYIVRNNWMRILKKEIKIKKQRKL